MTYNIICKKVELAESSKEKLLSKVRKLGKFFDDDTECRILVSMQRDEMGVEITFPYKGFIIRAESQNSDLITAADDCLTSIDRQIRKNKTKLAKRLRDDSLVHYDLDFGNSASVSEEDEFKIIKIKRIPRKPMMVEEAILQMNMLGHDFFIFNHPDTMAVNVVYRRKDGNYSLIELDQ
ncbi:MAG: ribosome-associated translation inhibitor RaiA [Clostridia bacterium]|nr:ribosome-associated translation inhibitor RaiA [Clostridia bacterium]